MIVLGKRRELLMKYFKTRASKIVLEEIIGNPHLPTAPCFTEYVDNFCDNDFIPVMDKTKFDIEVNY